MTAHPITRDDHQRKDAQIGAVVAGPSSGSSQKRSDAQWTPAAVGTSTRDDQTPVESHSGFVVAGLTSGSSHLGRATQASLAAVGAQPGDGGAAAIELPAPNPATLLASPFLALAADILDDAEDNRKANANRLGALTRTGPDEDGVERGLGLDERHPDVARVAALVEMLGKIEHQAELNLKRLLRQHPLHPWVLSQRGVGEKQAARLLAVVGDPYLNMQTGQPRTVSQLWAYCGHGDPARKLRKGATQAELFALGNPVAKSRTWLISCAVLKAQGPLSAVYYERKSATEGRRHAADCRRCGPSGRPAITGSPWSPAHRHADALRVLGKAMLRDLWIEAKRLHEEN